MLLSPRHQTHYFRRPPRFLRVFLKSVHADVASMVNLPGWALGAGLRVDVSADHADAPPPGKPLIVSVTFSDTGGEAGGGGAS